ncbi:MAG: alpha/beta fold hydrolase [Chloroflexi bacterium]|nr:alpha/beta fold hydrolase [Chloroflexota bacterium]
MSAVMFGGRTMQNLRGDRTPAARHDLKRGPATSRGARLSHTSCGRTARVSEVRPDVSVGRIAATSEEDWMPTATLNGLKHHYVDEGSGAPIFFLHGAGGSHQQFTDEHTPAISKTFRCISTDARGMGGSAHVATMPVTAWVDDQLALMDHLQIEKAHICGSSRGSRVALRFAIEHPGRVKSLLLDGPIIAMTEVGDEALNRNAGDGSRLPPSLQEDNRRRHGDDWMDVVRNYFNLRNLPGLQRYLNTRDEVHTIECPVLVMHGDVDDGTHPLASTFELFAKLGRARLCILPDIGGYSVNRFGGAAFARTVVDWVQKLETGHEITNAFATYDSCRSKLANLLTEVVAR